MAEKIQATKVEKKHQFEDDHEILVRIVGYDIPGSKGLYAGLTRIKGISWAISNIICIKLDFPKSKKISELSKEDIAKIEKFMKNFTVSEYQMNRRLDRSTGKTTHHFGADLDMKKEFDIKRLKEIKSYKGARHSQKLPVRGQRTKAHFRKNKLVAGTKKGGKK